MTTAISYFSGTGNSLTLPTQEYPFNREQTDGIWIPSNHRWLSQSFLNVLGFSDEPGFWQATSRDKNHQADERD